MKVNDRISALRKNNDNRKSEKSDKPAAAPKPKEQEAPKPKAQSDTVEKTSAEEPKSKGSSTDSMVENLRKTFGEDESAPKQAKGQNEEAPGAAGADASDGNKGATAPDADGDADAAPQGEAPPAPEGFADDVPQADTNAKLDELVGENPDYDALAEQLEGVEGDRLTVALAELPAEEADALAAALDERRPEDTEDPAYSDQVPALRDANASVRGGAGTSEPLLTAPETATYFREEVEKNPELADLLTKANPAVFDQVGEYLKSNPENADEIVNNLAVAAESIDPELTQTHIADRLREKLGGNVDSLIPGLAQASLGEKNALGGALQQSYAGEEAAETLQGAQFSPEEVAGYNLALDSEFPKDTFADLEAIHADRPAGVRQGVLNHLAESGQLDQLTDKIVANDETHAGSFANDDFAGLANLLRDADPQVLEAQAAKLVNIQSDSIRDAVIDSVGKGDGSLALSLELISAKQNAGSDDAEALYDNVDEGFASAAQHFAELDAKTDQHEADVAYLQEQFGAFGSHEDAEQAAHDYLASHQADFDATDAAAGGPLRDLQLFKDYEAKIGERENPGHVALLKQFPDLAATAEGQKELAKILEQGPGSFVEDLDRAATGTEEENEAFRLRSGAQLQTAVQVGVGERAGNSDRVADLLGGFEAAGHALPDDYLGITDADLSKLVQGVQTDHDMLSAGEAGQTSSSLLSDFADGSPVGDAAGGFAGAIGLGLLAKDLGENGLPDTAGAAFDYTVSALGDGADVASLFAKPASGLAGKLALAGTAASAISLGVSTLALANELASDDPNNVRLALHGATVLGSGVAFGALFSTSALAGPVGIAGAVVTAAASIGLGQYDRITAINRLEDSPEVEAYVNTVLPEGADASKLGTLLNADGSGDLVGGFVQGLAEHTGVSADEALVNLTQLSTDELEQFVTEAHAVVDGDHLTSEDFAADPQVIESFIRNWEEQTGQNLAETLAG